jgi:hypothetical protein
VVFALVCSPRHTDEEAAQQQGGAPEQQEMVDLRPWQLRREVGAARTQVTESEVETLGGWGARQARSVLRSPCSETPQR